MSSVDSSPPSFLFSFSNLSSHISSLSSSSSYSRERDEKITLNLCELIFIYFPKHILLENTKHSSTYSESNNDPNTDHPPSPQLSLSPHFYQILSFLLSNVNSVSSTRWSLAISLSSDALRKEYHEVQKYYFIKNDTQRGKRIMRVADKIIDIFTNEIKYNNNLQNNKNKNSSSSSSVVDIEAKLGILRFLLLWRGEATEEENQRIVTKENERKKNMGNLQNTNRNSNSSHFITRYDDNDDEDDHENDGDEEYKQWEEAYQNDMKLSSDDEYLDSEEEEESKSNNNNRLITRHQTEEEDSEHQVDTTSLLSSSSPSPSSPSHPFALPLDIAIAPPSSYYAIPSSAILYTAANLFSHSDESVLCLELLNYLSLPRPPSSLLSSIPIVLQSIRFAHFPSTVMCYDSQLMNNLICRPIVDYMHCKRIIMNVIDTMESFSISSSSSTSSSSSPHHSSHYLTLFHLKVFHRFTTSLLFHFLQNDENHFRSLRESCSQNAKSPMSLLRLSELFHHFTKRMGDVIMILCKSNILKHNITSSPTPSSPYSIYYPPQITILIDSPSSLSSNILLNSLFSSLISHLQISSPSSLSSSLSSPSSSFSLLLNLFLPSVDSFVDGLDKMFKDLMQQDGRSTRMSSSPTIRLRDDVLFHFPPIPKFLKKFEKSLRTIWEQSKIIKMEMEMEREGGMQSVLKSTFKQFSLCSQWRMRVKLWLEGEEMFLNPQINTENIHIPEPSSSSLFNTKPNAEKQNNEKGLGFPLSHSHSLSSSPSTSPLPVAPSVISPFTFPEEFSFGSSLQSLSSSPSSPSFFALPPASFSPHLSSTSSSSSSSLSFQRMKNSLQKERRHFAPSPSSLNDKLQTIPVVHAAPQNSYPSPSFVFPSLSPSRLLHLNFASFHSFLHLTLHFPFTHFITFHSLSLSNHFISNFLSEFNRHFGVFCFGWGERWETILQRWEKVIKIQGGDKHSENTKKNNLLRFSEEMSNLRHPSDFPPLSSSSYPYRHFLPSHGLNSPFHVNPHKMNFYLNEFQTILREEINTTVNTKNGPNWNQNNSNLLDGMKRGRQRKGKNDKRKNETVEGENGNTENRIGDNVNVCCQWDSSSSSSSLNGFPSLSSFSFSSFPLTLAVSSPFHLVFSTPNSIQRYNLIYFYLFSLKFSLHIVEKKMVSRAKQGITEKMKQFGAVLREIHAVMKSLVTVAHHRIEFHKNILIQKSQIFSSSSSLSLLTMDHLINIHEQFLTSVCQSLCLNDEKTATSILHGIRNLCAIAMMVVGEEENLNYYSYQMERGQFTEGKSEKKDEDEEIQYQYGDTNQRESASPTDPYPSLPSPSSLLSHLFILRNHFRVHLKFVLREFTRISHHYSVETFVREGNDGEERNSDWEFLETLCNFNHFYEN